MTDQTSNTPVTPTDSSKYVIEFILYTVYMFFGAAWATTGSVMPQIMADFNLDVSHASMMTNVILWAKIVGTIGTAGLTYKLGLRRAYLLGCALIGSAVLIPFVDNFYLLLAIRFMGGLGGAICLVSLVPTISKYFSAETAPSINSFNCTSNIIGTIIALTLAGYLSTVLGGWKNLLAAYGLITLVLGLLWFSVYKEDSADAKKLASNLSQSEKIAEIKKAVFNRVVWGMILQYIGAMIMMIFMFTYLPTYYAKYANLPADSLAHFSGSANQVGILIGAFIGPVMKRKGFNYKSWFLYTSAIMAVTTFIMLFATNDILILSCSALTGLLFATWLAFIFALPTEEVKGASTQGVTYMMSTFWFCTFVIATLNSQIISYTIDATGGFTTGFSYVFGLMVIAPIAAQLVFPKRHA